VRHRSLQGRAFGFDIEATSGQKLALATIFVPSNDVFFAPGPGGINLFEGDSPVDGPVTDDVTLWDAGTELERTRAATVPIRPRDRDRNSKIRAKVPTRTASFASSGRPTRLTTATATRTRAKQLT
jgi:hypothetical protein